MNAPTRIDTARVIHPPRGTELSCKNWLIEAPYRMIQHNLDPEGTHCRIGCLGNTSSTSNAAVSTMRR